MHCYLTAHCALLLCIACCQSCFTRVQLEYKQYCSTIKVQTALEYRFCDTCYTLREEFQKINLLVFPVEESTCTQLENYFTCLVLALILKEPSIKPIKTKYKGRSLLLLVRILFRELHHLHFSVL